MNPFKYLPRLLQLIPSLLPPFQLRDQFAKGILKPGLNVELEQERVVVNDIPGMVQKLKDFEQKLDWIERLDMINELAPMAPELMLQMEQHEQKRANMFAGNAKLKAVTPDKDPVLNDFKREMLFHRQAQAAVVEGIKRLHALGKKTKRPDDYFAEMAKTDEHMQKVRKHLMDKQEGQAKAEKVKQIREQRKMGKKVQQQARVKKEMEKKETLDQLKKFRKGKLSNLDFLESKKNGGGGKGAGQKGGAKKAVSEERKNRNNKFGFGGRKKGSKRNDSKSSMGLERKFKKPGGAGGGGRGGGSGSKTRPGKNKREKSKNRRK